MDQNTTEWLELRKRKIGASDAPIVMGVSPWSTPYQLWREKTGKNDKPQSEKRPGAFPNFAIERGVRWEPMARARYELKNDCSMEPVVMIHPEMDFIMASLDGYNEEKKRVLEIKIAGREVFDEAKSGRVHEKYVWQLEQQLLVSGADENHFYCCRVEVVGGREQITDDALVIYKSQPKLREQLIPKLQEFWGYVTRNEPPPLMSRDSLVLDDLLAKDYFRQLGDVALALEELNEKIDLLEAEESRLKKEVARFLTHPRVRVGQVELIRKDLKAGPAWTVKVHGKAS